MHGPILIQARARRSATHPCCTTSASTSPTANSASSSARRDAANRPCCAPSRGLRNSIRGASRSAANAVDGLPPAKRGIAMVFQSYALYPHLTLRENMAFALRLAKKPKAEIDAAVDRAAAIARASNNCSTASPPRCRAGSGSASRSAARSSASPKSSCSTSRCRTSTQRCASGCGSNLPRSIASSARPPFTSPMTRSRR